MISVIVPIYKGKKYINNILRMIKNNYESLNGETDLELILINDYPTESIEISGSFEFDVRIINNEYNVGIQQTRINGIKDASGEYVLLLDQDDLISDDCLISHYRAIKNKDFSISNGYSMMPDGGKKMLYSSNKGQNACLDLNCYIRYKNPIISPGQVLLKKQAIPSIWMTKPFANNGADDAFLWILMLVNGQEGVCIPECLYTHVYTGVNTSLNIANMVKSQHELNDSLVGILSKHDLRIMKRRSEYHGHYSEGLIYKLKYLDVCLFRWFYSRKYS